MARKYDIIERLKAKNERPFVMVDENISYQIDTSKTNVMSIMAVIDEMGKDETSIKEDTKKALEYIDSLNLTFDAYSLIFDVIMAAIRGVDLEEDSNEKETPKK